MYIHILLVGDIELRGGRNKMEGRVEVFSTTIYNTSGVWGIVCDDLWGKEEAQVVCKQLNVNSSIGLFLC